MQTQDPIATTSRGIEMQEGDDFVCPNCGCEIRLRHHGNPERMHQMRPFMCCCGSPMTKEQRAEA